MTRTAPTSDHAAFMAAILDAPADDAPRLAFADWLMENARDDIPDCAGVGTHHHAGKAGRVIHGVLHECDPRKPHHHHDEKCARRGNGFAERGEFIKVQIELAARGINDHHKPASWCDCWWCSRKRREAELFSSVWFGTVGTETYEWEFAADARDANVRYVIRRGFLDSVTAPLAVLIGGPCATCNGYGHHHRNDSLPVSEVDATFICATCKGVRRTPGVLAKLVREHPVTAVRATDREPANIQGGNEPHFRWYLENPDRELGPTSVPADVYCLIQGSHRTSPADAHAALSAALLAWANREAV